MAEPPPHRLGEGINAGQRQRTRGTTAEGGPALSDDTCKGVPQPGKRTGDPELLDLIDEETGRGSNQSSLTFDL